MISRAALTDVAEPDACEPPGRRRGRLANDRPPGIVPTYPAYGLPGGVAVWGGVLSVCSRSEGLGQRELALSIVADELQ